MHLRGQCASYKTYCTPQIVKWWISNAAFTICLLRKQYLNFNQWFHSILNLIFYFQDFGNIDRTLYIEKLNKLIDHPSELTVTDLHITAEILKALSSLSNLNEQVIALVTTFKKILCNKRMYHIYMMFFSFNIIRIRQIKTRQTDYITSMAQMLVMQVGLCIEAPSITNQEETARTFTTVSFIR